MRKTELRENYQYIFFLVGYDAAMAPIKLLLSDNPILSKTLLRGYE
ncbi:MAG: hypothetical protein ACYDA4_08700 [Ignavibacteriaceae bacterium]